MYSVHAGISLQSKSHSLSRIDLLIVETIPAETEETADHMDSH